LNLSRLKAVLKTAKNMSQYLLTILILLPVLGAVVTALYGVFVKEEKNYKWFALGFTSITFLLSLLLLGSGGMSQDGYYFVQKAEWIKAIGAYYHVGVDGISLWLIILTTFLMPICVISSWTYIEKRQLPYYIFLLLIETAMIGVFVSLDLLLFYLFFEASLVPMFFLIGVWGGENRIYASIKFFIYTAVGSLLMLAAVIALYVKFGTFDYIDILKGLQVSPFDPGTEILLFAAFAIAFAIKVPLFPVHTWLPDAHTEAPTAGSVILAGVLLKMGTYGLMRFNLALFPYSSKQAAWIFIGLAVIGIIYGALVAMVQPDVKRLVAYSSVSHMGFVVLGLFSFTEQGMQGALFQMLAHGISTGALFLIVGMIYERRHTRLISEFGGLSTPMPWFATFFVITSLASVGLPFLNGFVGEFLTLLGMWTSQAVKNPRIVTGFAATGVILSAVYMLWMLQRVVFGKITNARNKHLPDLNAREIGILIPLLILMLIMGVYPNVFLNRSKNEVKALRDHVLTMPKGGAIEKTEVGKK